MGGATASGTFTDSRDGQTYKWVKIGTQTWMAQSLNYKVDSSWCPDKDPTYCSAGYGRLYQWAAAMNLDTSYNNKHWQGSDSLKHQGICPSGWHIPTDSEWGVLIAYVGIDSAGIKLKSISGWKDTAGNSAGNGTDKYSFNVLPSGTNGSTCFEDAKGNWSCGYRTINIESIFLSASECKNDTEEVYNRWFGYGSTNSERGTMFKGHGLSVRCIQN